MATKKLKRATTKSSVKRRSLNRGGEKPADGAPAQQQDAKRRMGTFSSAGEHARVGGRTSGIVGQTTKRFGTQKRRKGR